MNISTKNYNFTRIIISTVDCNQCHPDPQKERVPLIALGLIWFWHFLPI